MAGAHDFTFEGGILNPGLGADEPTEEKMAALRGGASQRLAALKEELRAEGAELAVKEQALTAKAEGLAVKELEHAERDAALNARAKELEELAQRLLSNAAAQTASVATPTKSVKPAATPEK